MHALSDAHFEVLHTDVLFVGLVNERQCPNSFPICLRNPTEQRAWRLIHHDASENSVVTRSEGFCIRLDSQGAGCRRMGNALLETALKTQ